MENLIELMGNVYLVRTQAGYRKLLKQLGIHYREHDTRDYDNEIKQCTTDPNAFYEWECPWNGKTYKVNKQYPIKYPCIISFNFVDAIGKYYMRIKYFPIKHFSPFRNPKDLICEF